MIKVIAKIEKNQKCDHVWLESNVAYGKDKCTKCNKVKKQDKAKIIYTCDNCKVEIRGVVFVNPYKVRYINCLLNCPKCGFGEDLGISYYMVETIGTMLDYNWVKDIGVNETNCKANTSV